MDTTNKPNIKRLKEEKDVEGLIEALMDQDIGDALFAAGALGEIGDSRAIEPLLRFVKDYKGPIKRGLSATVKLALDKNDTIIVDKKDYSNVVEVLMQALKEKEPEVKEVAVKMITKIGEPPIASLIHEIKENPKNSLGVKKALAGIGEPAVESLILALKDESSIVRASVTSVLGKIGNTRAIEALIQALEDEGGGVRRMASFSLHQLGIQGALKQIIDVSIADLRHEDWMIRDSAVSLLGRIKDKRAIEALKKAWEDEEDDFVRQTLAMKLKDIDQGE